MNINLAIVEEDLLYHFEYMSRVVYDNSQIQYTNHTNNDQYLLFLFDLEKVQ